MLRLSTEKSETVGTGSPSASRNLALRCARRQKRRWESIRKSTTGCPWTSSAGFLFPNSEIVVMRAEISSVNPSCANPDSLLNEERAASFCADPDALLNEGQAASFLQVSVKTLQTWRHKGNGPPFVKISKRAIRYRRRDLIRFCSDRLVSSTSVPAYKEEQDVS